MDITTKLKLVLGDEKVLTDKQLESRYNHIWTMNTALKAKAYVLPSTTEEVAIICETCYKYKQPMVVFGGLTNLVGGTETNGDEVVISMEKMNKVVSLDHAGRTMTVQSGIILEEIQNLAKENDLFFPLSFGAKGSCQIGGCISTNAGGIRVLKYGMTRQLVLGLEVVLPNGEVISSLKQMLKDNSGYDLKQLFIGAEGTLGIVTTAVLKLEEIPVSRNSVFLAFSQFEKIIRFLKLVKKGLGGQLSAFEFIERSAYETLTNNESMWKPPISHGYNYYILIETTGGHKEKDAALLEELLENTMIEDQLFEDAVFAYKHSDLEWFWNIREDVSILANIYKYDQHFDVSLPLVHMQDYITQVKQELESIAEVDECFVFGHLADGNMHFIVGKSSNSVVLKNEINEIVYSSLKHWGGSISAEHGIGLHKKNYLSYCREESEIELMRTLKKTFDPEHLLNTSKIF
ncbi:FAD-binding oxidoreductase [Olleya sp. R77988]|uniref:FAD-binding oxidoreductase n=1 Tax=Olleya sp. R77988 TaxID=3093875 RepID=UPI0037C6EE04